MLRLFIKDNTNGHVHEYGTDKHDSLILQEDGSLHYEHLQGCVGTKYPEEGFSFCLEDGTIPEWDLEHGVEPYIDIAGEYYTKPKSNADRIRRTDDVELMNRIYELHVLLSEFGYYELTEQFCDGKAECAGGEDCNEDRLKACILRWLQRPVEDTGL